jgi:hypothetical protein
LAQSQPAPNALTRYYVAFLRPDPAQKPLAKEDAERLQEAHMANIHKMAADGILISAGLFDDTPHHHQRDICLQGRLTRIGKKPSQPQIRQLWRIATRSMCMRGMGPLGSAMSIFDCIG